MSPNVLLPMSPVYTGSTLAVTGAVACAPSAVGCVVATAGVAVTGFGMNDIKEGVETLREDHAYTSGQRVVDSFSAESFSGEHNPVADLATQLAITGVESVAAKVGLKQAGKLYDKYVEGNKGFSGDNGSASGEGDFGPLNQPVKVDEVDGASAGSSGSIQSAEVPGVGTSNRPVIIGEDQYGRVDVFAKNNGGDTISDWLGTTGKTWSPEVNKEFINAMKEEGREFIDIGPAFDRRLLNRMDSAQGRPASAIYGSERKQLLDYGNRTQLYDRAGKYQGGVRGLDN